MFADHYLKWWILDQVKFIDITNVPILKHLPAFYQEIQTYFNEIKTITNKVFCNNIFLPPISGNDHIKSTDTYNRVATLYYKSWIECGLYKIDNLKFRNGILDEDYIGN